MESIMGSLSPQICRPVSCCNQYMVGYR